MEVASISMEVVSISMEVVSISMGAATSSNLDGGAYFPSVPMPLILVDVPTSL